MHSKLAVELCPSHLLEAVARRASPIGLGCIEAKLLEQEDSEVDATDRERLQKACDERWQRLHKYAGTRYRPRARRCSCAVARSAAAADEEMDRLLASYSSAPGDSRAGSSDLPTNGLDALCALAPRATTLRPVGPIPISCLASALPRLGGRQSGKAG